MQNRDILLIVVNLKNKMTNRMQNNKKEKGKLECISKWTEDSMKDSMGNKIKDKNKYRYKDSLALYVQCVKNKSQETVLNNQKE